MEIRAGIASIPEREEGLRIAVKSLVPQVDSLHVCLNNYDHIPVFLVHPKITVYEMDNELGDGGKFIGAIGYDGYYFGCDDDLKYPYDYCEYLISKIGQYNGVVSLLGKVYGNRPIESFRKGYTDCFRCLGSVHGDYFVDVVGSGACGFHTKDLKLNPYEWERINMADIWVSKAAFDQGVPLVAVRHPRLYVKYTLGKDDWRIWADDHDDEYQTKILNSFLI